MRLKTLSSFKILAIPGLLLFIFIRAIPSKSLDHGIYISVASRLLAGDKLYVDVWDNKQPYFYFFLAFARWISPYGDLILECFWIGLLAFSSYKILRTLVVPQRIAIPGGLFLVPIIATGSHYVSGQTHLPGIALYFLMRFFLLKNWFYSSGIILGLIFNINIQVFIFCLLALLLEAMIARLPIDFARVSYGFGSSLIIGSAVLALRGEFLGYLNLFIENFRYSGEATLLKSENLVYGHVQRLLSKSGLITSILLIVLEALLFRYLRRQRASSSVKIFAALNLSTCVISTLSAFVVLSVSGLWSHHLQLLYIPAIELILLLILILYDNSFDVTRSFLLLGVIAVGLSGANPNPYLKSIKEIQIFTSSFSSQSTSTQLLKNFASKGDYMRIGSNDDFGHAFGLENWNLTCPIINQYTFTPSSRLRDLVSCMASSDFILISESGMSLLKRSEMNLNWRLYGPIMEATLKKDFDCQIFRRSHDNIKICKRNE